MLVPELQALLISLWGGKYDDRNIELDFGTRDEEVSENLNFKKRKYDTTH